MLEPFESHAGLGEVMWRASATMMMITGPRGEVYDANDSFCEWVGYSRQEFRRELNPATWKAITVPGEDLQSDIEQAHSCMRGEIKSYVLRKHYVPKGGSPKFIELRVWRYPREGVFRFFFCEARELNQDAQEAWAELQRSQELWRERLDKMSHTVEKKSLVPVLDWASKNRWMSIPAGLVLAYLLFGRSAVEVAKDVMGLFQ